MALQHAAFGDLQANPFALDGVGVFNRDLRVFKGDRADLLPGLFRLMQAVGDQGMGMFVEHGDILFLPGGASLTRPTFGAVVGPVSEAPPGEKMST